MNPFVRFIFILVIAGAAINLAIVLVGNNLGHNRQQKIESDEWERIDKHYALLVERSREPRAHILVESQELSDSTVLNSTILLQRYRYARDLKRNYITDSTGRIIAYPLAIQRITLPGDKIRIDAVALNFRDDLPDSYRFLQNKFLAVLSEIHSADEANSSQWTHLYTHGEIPDTVRDSDWTPSLIERNLWLYVELAVAAKRESNQQVLETHPGIELTTPKFAEQTLTRGALYMVLLDHDAVSILQIADSTIAADMKNRAQSPTTQLAPAKIAP